MSCPPGISGRRGPAPRQAHAPAWCFRAGQVLSRRGRGCAVHRYQRGAAQRLRRVQGRCPCLMHHASARHQPWHQHLTSAGRGCGQPYPSPAKRPSRGREGRRQPSPPTPPGRLFRKRSQLEEDVSVAGDPGPWRLPRFAAPAVGQPGSAAAGGASRGGRGTQRLQRQEGRSVPERGCCASPLASHGCSHHLAPRVAGRCSRASQGCRGKRLVTNSSQAAPVKGQPRALPRGGGTVCGSCWASRLAGAWPFPAPVRATPASPWLAMLPSPSRSSCSSPALALAPRRSELHSRMS